MPPQSPPDTAIPIRLSRPCWECHRRRRHCDFSRPDCNKCLAAHVVCPGYEDKKPLTWLTPGTILSRPRRTKKSAPRLLVDKPMDVLDDRAASLHVALTSSPTVQTLDWKDETTNMVEAVYYFNSQIYSSLSPALELSPSPYVIKLLPEYLPYLSVTYRHCLACLVISHHIRQLPQGFSSILLNQMWQRLLYHRASAICAIRECIETGQSSIGNKVTYDIFTLMYAELQFSPMGSDWRLHYEGFMRIVTFRGGFENLLQSGMLYEYGLLGFMIIGTMANTTAPAPSQTAASIYFSSTNFISEIYKKVIYPTMLCPHSLLKIIIHINYIRHQIATLALSIEEGQIAATALCQEINDFSAEKWVKLDAPLPKLWLLVGQIYRSAVLLFCTTSLQDLHLLSKDQQHISAKATHSENLFRLLPQAMKAPQLMPSMSWPLVVAGIHAEENSTARRSYVKTELRRLSHDIGVAPPLLAMNVLEKYWASSKKGWDDCFDDIYVFVW